GLTPGRRSAHREGAGPSPPGYNGFPVRADRRELPEAKEQEMDRRSFLKLSAASGVVLMTPFGPRAAFAAPRRYDGPYWLLIHAAGGWDPTYVCDPKGNPINRLFKRHQIGTAGHLKFAPVEYKDGCGRTI